MYHKVIVMELKDKYALAMAEDGQILRIQLKCDIKVGDCIYILDEDLYHEEASKSTPIAMTPITSFSAHKDKKYRTGHLWRQIVAAVAAIALLLTSAEILTRPTRAYAMVSVDGEHSLEFNLDHDHDISEILSGPDHYTDEELEKLHGSSIEKMQPYVSEDALNSEAIIVGYAMYKDGSMKDHMELHQKLENAFGSKNILYIGGNSQDIVDAKKAGKSLGIYLLEKAISKKDYSSIRNQVTEEELYHLIKKNPKVMENPKNKETIHEVLSEYEKYSYEKENESNESEYELNEKAEEYEPNEEEAGDYEPGESSSGNEFEPQDSDYEEENQSYESGSSSNSEEPYESEENSMGDYEAESESEVDN